MPDWRTGAIVFVATLTAIAWLSLGSPEATGTDALAPMATNALHLPAYMALGFAAAWMLQPLERYHLRLHRVSAVALVVAAGTALELVQPFTGRSASLGDVAIDTLGAVLALLLWHAAGARRRSGRAA